MFDLDTILIRKSDKQEFIIIDAMESDGKFRQTDLYSIQSVGQPFESYLAKTKYEIDRDFQVKDS